MTARLFVFIQLEFPWALGPPDGRYLLRGGPDGEPERVVVLTTLGAPRLAAGPRLAARRRARERDATPEPAPVTTARATMVDPVPLAIEAQAKAWLAELDREREVEAATAILNRVLHMHRLSAADTDVHEVSPAQALVIRAGWGEGEQVADGVWSHAREIDPTARRGGRRRTRRDRSAALRPQERLAALLGGRTHTLMCEELVLRSREDLDADRFAHAAIQLDAAYTTAIPELRAEGRQDLAVRIAELQKLQEGVAALARAAVPGTTSGQEGAGLDLDILEHALVRLESALRARTATGFNLQ